MLPPEFQRMYLILIAFLGEAKGGFDGEHTQLQFGCPHCAEKHGDRELQKYNLECNFFVFHCWKCASEDEDEMHGSVFKLIKLYGNEQLYKDYKECVVSLKESKLYNIDFANNFKVDLSQIDEVKLPNGFRPFKEDRFYPPQAMDYIQKRGITWDIIHEYNLGFTTYSEDDKIASNRIIIPSYNKFGELNYWTGRDFTNNPKRQRYYNPKIERKTLIFNEEKIQWDADINIVEGPFDHLVVPNSIPLLGKALDKDYKLYWELLTKTNANINIFLDGDAYDTVIKTYKALNHGRLYNKIRYVPIKKENDPSLLFQLGGNRAILEHLKNTQQIKEVYLQ
jgi:hypothetical protein